LSDSSSFMDERQRDCAWYAERRGEAPEVCHGQEVSRSCPIACPTVVQCAGLAKDWEPFTPRRVWERVMHVRPRLSLGDLEQDQKIESAVAAPASICLSELSNADEIIKRCEALRDARDPRLYGYPPNVNVNNNWMWQISTEERGLNITDCALLKATMDPHCTFRVPNRWTTNFTFDWQAATYGGFTITFWIRPSDQKATAFEPMVELYSSLSPPLSLLYIKGTTLTLHARWGAGQGGTDAIVIDVPLATDRWTHMSMWYNKETSEVGFMVDAKYATALALPGLPEWYWPDDGVWLEAVILRSEMLISPVEFVPEKLEIGQLQKNYYDNRVAMKTRSGPLSHDSVREVEDHIHYDHRPFSAPGMLLAPPILQTSRVTQSVECPASSGTTALQRLWVQVTQEGPLCRVPYSCPQELMESSRDLLSCRGEQSPELFFGRGYRDNDGKKIFTEFLATIADASFLVREGQLLSTDTFLDSQTTSVAILFVLFAPQTGTVSAIRVSAELGVRTNVEYTISHLQPVEGEAKTSYFIVGTLLIILSLMSFMSLARRLAIKFREGGSRHAGYRIMICDALCTLGVAIYAALGCHSISGSADVIEELIRDLMLVRWASKDVLFEEKMDEFVAASDRLDKEIQSLQMRQTFVFILAMVMLLRVLAATYVHPRVALLVNTVVEGFDDFWHFLLLCTGIVTAFASLAVVFFGGDVEGAKTMGTAFSMQFDMLLGSLPEQFGETTFFTLYCLLFNVICFFFLVNFFLAIIVDTYAKVKGAIELSDAEQDLPTDVYEVLVVRFKKFHYGWPSIRQVIHTLQEQRAKFNTDCDTLAAVSPSWSRASRITFLQHYMRHKFLEPHPLPIPDISLSDAVTDIERYISNHGMSEEDAKPPNLKTSSVATVRDYYSRQGNEQRKRARSGAMLNGSQNSALYKDSSEKAEHEQRQVLFDHLDKRFNQLDRRLERLDSMMSNTVEVRI